MYQRHSTVNVSTPGASGGVPPTCRTLYTQLPLARVGVAALLHTHIWQDFRRGFEFFHWYFYDPNGSLTLLCHECVKLLMKTRLIFVSGFVNRWRERWCLRRPSSRQQHRKVPTSPFCYIMKFKKTYTILSGLTYSNGKWVLSVVWNKGYVLIQHVLPVHTPLHRPEERGREGGRKSDVIDDVIHATRAPDSDVAINKIFYIWARDKRAQSAIQ